jgi:hypothetical protein
VDNGSGRFLENVGAAFDQSTDPQYVDVKTDLGHYLDRPLIGVNDTYTIINGSVVTS